MSTGAQVFITIIALMTIMVICWSISDSHNKIRKMGEVESERDIYAVDMQYWKNKYWELHDIHYGKEEEK